MIELTRWHIEIVLSFMTGEGALPTRDGSHPLEGLDLARVRLRDANLRDANLRNATLAEADMAGANLRDANLAGANLAEADMAGANTVGTLIQMAYTGASRTRNVLYAVRVDDAGRVSREGAVRFWTGCQKGISLDDILARSQRDHGDSPRGRAYRKVIEALVEADQLLWEGK